MSLCCVRSNNFHLNPSSAVILSVKWFVSPHFLRTLCALLVYYRWARWSHTGGPSSSAFLCIGRLSKPHLPCWGSPTANCRVDIWWSDPSGFPQRSSSYNKCTDQSRRRIYVHTAQRADKETAQREHYCKCLWYVRHMGYCKCMAFTQYDWWFKILKRCLIDFVFGQRGHRATWRALCSPWIAPTCSTTVDGQEGPPRPSFLFQH